MSAQDDKRERIQKERFGFYDEHQRDGKHDAFYKMPIDFKTRNVAKGGQVSTKRKFKLQTLKEWENTIIIVSDYDGDSDPDNILETDYIIFPANLLEWREEQLRKLTEANRASYYSMDDLEAVRTAIPVKSFTKQIENIFEKFLVQMHLNDPKIGKTIFTSNGTKVHANGKKIETKHPEWFIRVPAQVDKAQFLRQKIHDYINHKLYLDSSYSA